jgi:hypothetical protein
MSGNFYTAEEVSSIQQFVRQHKYPTYEQLQKELDQVLTRLKGTRRYQHTLDVYSEFGPYQYEASKVIYENIYNPQTVKKCGEHINRKNGFAGLQSVYYIMCWFSPFKQAQNNELKYTPRYIEQMWDGVGQWRS